MDSLCPWDLTHCVTRSALVNPSHIFAILLEVSRWLDLLDAIHHLCLGRLKDMGMGQNPVPLVNIKIAGKWMFIPLKMVLIGIDPYPYPAEI